MQNQSHKRTLRPLVKVRGNAGKRRSWAPKNCRRAFPGPTQPLKVRAGGQGPLQLTVGPQTFSEFLGPQIYTLTTAYNHHLMPHQEEDKYRLSLTNPREALHHDCNGATNKGGRSVACDGGCSPVIASYLSKVANFNLPNLHLAPPLGVTRYEFCRDLRHQKTRVCGVCMNLRLAVSVEH